MDSHYFNCEDCGKKSQSFDPDKGWCSKCGFLFLCENCYYVIFNNFKKKVKRHCKKCSLLGEAPIISKNSTDSTKNSANSTDSTTKSSIDSSVKSSISSTDSTKTKTGNKITIEINFDNDKEITININK